MTLAICRTRRATAQEWDAVWERCEYGTYFHSRHWAELWARYTRWSLTPAPVHVEFTDGATAILPLSRERGRSRLGRGVVSSPATTFGGWIAADGLEEAHGRLLMDVLLQPGRRVVWRVNPYDPIAARLPIEGAQEDDTQVLDLKDGFDAVYKEWSKGHKSAARKAAREGVVAKPATDKSEWRGFWEAYESSLSRWGERASSAYGARLVEALRRRSDSGIRLWVAKVDGTVAAGALCLYASRHVGYWLGATDERYFKLRPSNLVMHEAIKDACERGFRWFDFNPSGGHDSVREFKRRFGAEELRAPVVTRDPDGPR